MVASEVGYFLSPRAWSRTLDAVDRIAAGVRAIPHLHLAADPEVTVLAIETDDASGLATRVAAVRLGARLEEAVPRFWL